MKRATHILQVGFLCVLAGWLGEGIASAQFRYNPYQAYAQNQAMQQNMYAQQFIANQAGRVYGANYGIPFYASTVANFYGTPNNYTPYYPPVYAPPAPAYSGSYVNPYSPAAPGYGVNPYTPVDPNVANSYSPYNPYSPYNNSYGAGSILMGQADVMRAYGQNVNAIEQARITRELAKQAQIETKKKQFEYQMWVKANTPTYTQEQARIGKITLERIQRNSTPGEISGGKALNYLLDDLRKFSGKKVSLEATTLSDDVLSHINVTKGTYGVGLLRDSGKVTIPIALQDAKERKDLEKKLESLVLAASNNEKFGNKLTDVRRMIEDMRADLVKKVNETPSAQYMDAKQFLQELYESTRGIETGEMANHTKFQKWVEEGKGERTVQDFKDYMVANGLRIGPATANDEAAYRALHSAMASFDIAMNSQFGEAGRE